MASLLAVLTAEQFLQRPMTGIAAVNWNGRMTDTEAKELLISGMNYAAYRETDHSLWDSDMNKLFGGEHYVSGRAVFQRSVWGDGEEFEENMAKLLRWAVQLGSAKGSYEEAIRTLASGEHYLNRIIKRAGLNNHGLIIS